MKERIVLIGGGGHCKVVIDAIRKNGQYDIEGIVDAGLASGSSVSGVPILGGDEMLPDLYEKNVRNAFLGIGSIGDCSVRRRLYGLISDAGFNIPVIIHPKAVIADDVEIQEGTFVAASATVNPGTKIGRNVIINTSSSIDHDCRIEEFVHVAPGVTLSGGVSVGSESHIGTGANVVQNVKIGRNCFIKAGSLVKTDQPDNQGAWNEA